ncbi:hypothetical protein [Myroides odoratus]|uniref:hypothetical protein n=1 Tax=Myroides odoratus TaxID=256 RepID=UPI0039AFD843
MGFYTKEVERKYYGYKRSRIRRLIGLWIHVFIWSLFTGLMAYQQYVGIEGGVIGIQADFYNSSERMFYELPLFWLPLILVQFVFYYAERLPILSKWQDRLEQKEFNRLKSTYEYQLKLKDEPTPNTHY